MRKRAVDVPAPSTSSKKPRLSDKQELKSSYVGRRVAKRFDDGEVYFGEVTKWFRPDMVEGEVDLWQVTYDDDDVEDYEEDEIKQHIQLFESMQGK